MFSKFSSEARYIDVNAPSCVDIPKHLIKLDIILYLKELLFAKSEFTNPGWRQLTVISSFSYFLLLLIILISFLRDSSMMIKIFVDPPRTANV